MTNLTMLTSDNPVRIMDKDIEEMLKNYYDVGMIVSVWDTFSDDLEECYGPVEEWDVSFIKNMSGWFMDGKTITDLSKWDVSSVQDMSCMFHNNNNKFRFNISKWDVSNVINIENMFSDASVIEEEMVSKLWNLTNDQIKSMFGE